MKLTDANGKVFEVEMSNVQDMISENAEIEVNKDSTAPSNIISMTALDAEGKQIDVTSISDEDKKDKSKLPKALDVTFEATHSGGNRNNVFYHSDSMEKDAASWMVPYAKPLIKNHDSWDEPLGRAVSHQFGRSNLNPDRDCISVTFRVTDADAIEKFMDGRYRTMSIGGSVGHISCNICGKDILKDGVFKFCGHWKGEVYNSQKAIWNCRNIEYKEGSVVNMPADDWAQVVNQKPVTDSQQDSQQGGQGDMSKTAQSAAQSNILDDIDNLAGQQGDAQTTTGGTAPQGEGTPQATQTDNNGGQQGDGSQTPNTQQDGQPSGDDEVKVLKDKIAALEGQVSTLTADKETLNTKVSDLEGKLQDSEKKVTELTEELKVSDEDGKASRQQAVKLAVMNKELMAKRLVDRELFAGTIKAEDVEAKVKEYLTKPAKELNDSIASAQAPQQRPLVNIPSPGAVNDNDPNAVKDADKTGEKTGAKKARTLKDFEATLFA